MSGTSMDGVDVALIETDGDATVVFGPTGHYPYSDADRALLRNALAEAATLEDRDARPGVLAVAERLGTGPPPPSQASRPRSAAGRRSHRASASTSLMIFAPPTSPPAARARRSCPCSI